MNSYLSLLRTSNSKKFTQAEINFFIENSFKIAHRYVNQAASRIRKLILSSEINLEEVAIDAVVPLFETNSQGHFTKLHDAYKRWSPYVNSESDAMFFLNKIIAKKVNQYISLILKDHDPLFAKILDSVEYYCRKEGFSKVNYFGINYIMETNDYDTDKEIISYSDFEKLPFYLFENNKYALKRLFNYLKEETDFFPAVPLNPLVSRLKNFYSSGSYNQKNQEVQFHLRFETVEFIEFGLEKATEKLETTYYQKGKVSQKEKDALVKALNLMAEDIGHGGITRGLYKYLSLYIDDLTKKNFNAKYRHILEYLLKVMKTTIAQKLSA